MNDAILVPGQPVVHPKKGATVTRLDGVYRDEETGTVRASLVGAASFDNEVSVLRCLWGYMKH